MGLEECPKGRGEQVGHLGPDGDGVVLELGVDWENR